MDFTSTHPPLLLPSAADASDLTDVCLWCSIKGHSHRECMRMALDRANENTLAIMGLSQRVDVMQRVVEACNELGPKVTNLEG